MSGRQKNCIRLNGRYYQIRKSIKGKVVTCQTRFTRRRDAETYFKTWYRQQLEGIERKSQIRAVFSKTGKSESPIFFNHAAAEYLERRQKISKVEDIRYIEQLIDYIGRLPLDRVNVDTLIPYIKDRKQQGVKDRTVNCALAVINRILKASFMYYRDENGEPWLKNFSPLPLLSKTHSDAYGVTWENDLRRAKVLTWVQQQKILMKLSEPFRSVIEFVMMTGCRDQEARLLKWAEEEPCEDRDCEVSRSFRECSADSLRGRVFHISKDRIAEKKGGDRRYIVLCDRAMEIAEAQRGNGSDYLFLSERRRPYSRLNHKSWQRMREQLGMDFTIHDLRHTFCTRLTQAGVGDFHVNALMGHSRIGTNMSQWYTQAFPLHLNELVAAVRKMERLQTSRIIKMPTFEQKLG